MSAQPGNTLRKTSHNQRALYRAALLEASGYEGIIMNLDRVPDVMRKIAMKHIEACLEGDQLAIKNYADRVDGKPIQRVTLGDDDEHGNPMIPTIAVRMIWPDERR